MLALTERSRTFRGIGRGRTDTTTPAPLAQLVARLHGKEKVAGSNPAGGSHSQNARPDDDWKAWQPMYATEYVYGFDIETLNDEERGFNGLDPARSEITEIAVATDESINGGGEVFQGAESKILNDFFAFVRSLKPGLMTGWNSSFFDGPFIDYRYDEVAPRHVVHATPPLTLLPQPSLRPKYNAMPGYGTPRNPGGGYALLFAADGGVHAHLDVAQAYHRFADEQNVKWGLKPVCEAQGIEMVNLDRTRLHEYTPAEVHDYVLSDGRGTRELALRLLGLDYTPYR